MQAATVSSCCCRCSPITPPSVAAYHVPKSCSDLLAAAYKLAELPKNTTGKTVLQALEHRHTHSVRPKNSFVGGRNLWPVCVCSATRSCWHNLCNFPFRSSFTFFLSFFTLSVFLSFFLKPRLFPRRHHHHNLRSLSSATNYFRRSGRSAVNSAYLMQIVSTRELTAETIASPPPHHHQNVVQDLLLFSAVLPLTGTSPPRR